MAQGAIGAGQQSCHYAIETVMGKALVLLLERIITRQLDKVLHHRGLHASTQLSIEDQWQQRRG
ncbi:hypothetical protein D3C79_620430 [compost metagenome]